MDSSVFARMPMRLRMAAWSAGNGEPAWPADRAEAAARWCAAQRLAVVGGEIYEVLPGTQWGSFRQDWLVTPLWLPGEPWREFVRRCLGAVSDALAAVGSEHGELKVFLAISASTDVLPVMSAAD